MAKKVQVFEGLMEGFKDAIVRKKDQRVGLRITEILRIKSMRPRLIKRIRKALGASQSVFAYVVSPKVMQAGTRSKKANQRSS